MGVAEALLVAVLQEEMRAELPLAQARAQVVAALTGALIRSQVQQGQPLVAVVAVVNLQVLPGLRAVLALWVGLF